MADYRLAVGPHDPEVIAAATDADAIRQAGALIESRHAAELQAHPETAMTLIGPGGLLTSASQRIDDFVRLSGAALSSDTDDLQLAETPDCNIG
jgi:hypothetical protein